MTTRIAEICALPLMNHTVADGAILIYQGARSAGRLELLSGDAHSK
jgi:hypothetical protein